MQQKLAEIAERIREMRELSGIGVETMAGAVGVTIPEYQRIESGQQDMSVGLLHRIAAELKVDLALLLSGEAPRMKVFTVTRKGRGVRVERRKQYRYQSLAANFMDKKIEPFMVTVEPEPNLETLEQNSHVGQEFNYLLEGRLQVEIHGNTIVLEEGDAIFFDASHGHAMRALDGRPARFLAVIY